MANGIDAWRSEFNATNRAKEEAKRLRQDMRDLKSLHAKKNNAVIDFIDSNLNDKSLGLKSETRLLLKAIKSQLLN